MGKRAGDDKFSENKGESYRTMDFWFPPKVQRVEMVSFELSVFS